AALDINAPLTLGGGDASRPYASLGRIIRLDSWGQRLRTRYDSLQVAVNKPFTHGFLLKGAYTLAKAMNESDNDGRATLSFNTPSNQQTADLVGSYTVRGDAAPNGTFFDTSAFVQPTGVRFGNTGRNQFYGPGGNDLDLSVFRIFPMGAQRRLEARVEIGNLFNSGVFQNPQNDVTSGTFGQITA